MFLLSLLLIVPSFAKTDDRRELLGTILSAKAREEGVDKSYDAAFKNPDGQTCRFAAKGYVRLGHQEGIKCGWNGKDAKFQLKMDRAMKHVDCIAECQKRQWCNYAFTPAMGWGYKKNDCFLFGTCNDQTTNSPGGILHEKKCPKTPELPCESGCTKYKAWWAVDGDCDMGCMGCDAYWKGNKYDNGACDDDHLKATGMPGSAADALYYKKVGDESLGVVDYAVYGFAVLGFAVISFGAYKYYTGKAQDQEHEPLC